jgi:hypothetical protein
MMHAGCSGPLQQAGNPEADHVSKWRGMVEPARQIRSEWISKNGNAQPSLPRTQIIVNQGIAGGRNDGVARA